MTGNPVFRESRSRRYQIYVRDGGEGVVPANRDPMDKLSVGATLGVIGVFFSLVYC